MTFDDQAPMTLSTETPENTLIEKAGAWAMLGLALCILLCC